MSRGEIVHVEIPAVKSADAGKFYQEVFGWGIQSDEALNYTMFDTGGVGGGFNELGEQIKVGDVLVYIESDDIEADLKVISAKGGETVMPKTEIPNMGWFSWFKDPTGNVLALYMPMNPGS